MRTKTGVVTSNKMNKTLVVVVHRYVSDSKYKKRYLVSKKFYAHCEDSAQFPIGKEVTICESRPLSKLKRWVVAQGPISSDTTPS